MVLIDLVGSIGVQPVVWEGNKNVLAHRPVSQLSQMDEQFEFWEGWTETKCAREADGNQHFAKNVFIFVALSS